MTESEEAQNTNTSALRDNIERKGKNAYYYAHGHKVNGPKWDGKPEPKLLSKEEFVDTTSSANNNSAVLSDVARRSLAFDSKSTITSYAFCDEEAKVKIYVNLPSVGENDGVDVQLEHTSSSFDLIVRNYKNADAVERLGFARLFGAIDGASYKVKKDKIIVTLVKTEALPWARIGDRGGGGNAE
mmetsp:Transcript_3093/g.4500  ORF Transcript_3093/g.4500 Transcript_3093/m.4500 type:complete len:185 (-) Transcript_3093:114-668(-)|eukprot:CAMPEP_0116031202 /NCGR_PEP_ID=MMETSP0321-20121206/17357_1 /TAXON_ID=163516 /ORGANISM="Leptocylindrus danicus var. danicus, Strain B650" /LENGTH=184 /DNA_ID=CAMNT_0003506249 /DNA_START=24 /DNA_END=578 /DNA_ORIENTATION=+